MNMSIQPQTSETALSAAQIERIEYYAQARWSENTQRSYRNVLNVFTTYMDANFAVPGGWTRQQIATQTTTQHVLAFIVWCADSKLASKTIDLRTTCLKKHIVQSISEKDWKGITEFLRAIKRDRAGKEEYAVQKSDAVMLPELMQLLSVPQTTGTGIEAVRNRALLTVLFHGAFRREECAGLLWRHIRTSLGGITVLITHSKGDQQGAGDVVAIRSKPDEVDRCAVTALDQWKRYLVEAGEFSLSNPVFPRINVYSKELHPTESMGVDRIYRVVKECITSAGLDGKYTPHSFRAGCITQATANGAALTTVMHHARHKDPKTTSGYVREIDAMGVNSVAALL